MSTRDKGSALRAAHRDAGPLVTPLAHDALSARLIAAAGFKSFNIGGSTLLAARHALPDLGLAALGEMSAAIRDIIDAVDLPCMADADDGYGDLKSVVQTVMAYERIGVAGLLLEDQGRSGKQPGAAAARAVIPVVNMVAKLRAALAARQTDLVVIARSDAVGVEGVDGALRRAERYLAAGADGVFVAGLSTPEMFARVGSALRGSWNMAAMFEGGATPFLSPQDLHAMGFSQVAYPMALMQRVTGLLEQTLVSLRRFAAGEVSGIDHADLLSPAGFRAAVAMDAWNAIEDGKVDISALQARPATLF
jgi:2-methylisocitrate lyase-like PEP mutase family enzyme